MVINMSWGIQSESEMYLKTTKSHSIVALFSNVPVRKDHF